VTGEIFFVFGLLLAAVVLFASGWFRLDVVALLVILILMLSPILSPAEALAGFGDAVVILIAGLFVVGEGLVRTGVAHTIGNRLLGFGGTSETRILVLLMLVVAGLSAFMSSTGTVAIFIPVALNLALKAGISPSRLLMPMALASLMGGMLTLIGTPPNLVVNNQLIRDGFEPFGFFSFTPIGLLVLAAGIGYVLIIGQKWLPDRGDSKHPGGNHLSLQDLIDMYALTGQLHRLRIQAGSPMEGKTLAQAKLPSRYGVTVLGLERHQRRNQVFAPITMETIFRAGDIIYIVAKPSRRDKVVQDEGVETLEVTEEQSQIAAREIGLVEVLVAPRSELIGRTLKEIRFRERYGVTVMGILRKGEPLKENLLETRMQFGDAFLLVGEWDKISMLQGRQKDFLVLNLPREIDDVAPNRSRASVALAIMVGMMALMTFNLVPAVTAVLLAALAMVLTKCVGMKTAYRAINWESLVLIAGMLPMATALDKTGGAQLIADGLVDSLGSVGPMALLAGLFLLTSVFSQFISNTATTVLVAPIAVDAALMLGISPYPVLMTIALAASTAFATPMATPLNTMIMGPGDYRFIHYVKVGVPLQILVMVITLLAVPLLFPL
jgi:di/tricarboxylate transporter